MSDPSTWPALRQGREIDDTELVMLLARADYEFVCGKGPYLSVSYCPPLSIHRFQDLEEAQRAVQLIDRTACGGRCSRSHELLIAPEEYAQRKHVGCDWPRLEPWGAASPFGRNRPKAWAGRYDPRKRAQFFAKRHDEEPDVDRARAAILARCRKCADCRREAGPEHLAKLQRAHDRERPVPVHELLRMVLD